jgi:hypothetical protein
MNQEAHVLKTGRMSRRASDRVRSGILMKPKLNILDLAGTGSKHSTSRQMKLLLDKMRDEDA